MVNEKVEKNGEVLRLNDKTGEYESTGIYHEGNGQECPVCREYTFHGDGNYEVCPVCGWEDDSYQREFPDELGCNGYTLNEYRKRYKDL